MNFTFCATFMLTIVIVGTIIAVIITTEFCHDHDCNSSVNATSIHYLRRMVVPILDPSS